MRKLIVGKIAFVLSLLICILTFAGDSVTYGDVNEDKRIDASDALLVLKNAAVLVELEDFQKTNADVNGDNFVDSRDALLILKYAAIIIDEFPIMKHTAEPTSEVTEVPTLTATVEPTEIPTITPEPTEIPTATPEPTEIPTATPKPTATPEPEPIIVENRIPNYIAEANTTARGDVITINYYSKDYYSNNNQWVLKDAYVYLPEGYDENKQYNVVYFLHGINGTKDEWGVHNTRGKIRNVLDNLISYGEIEPVIAVFPTGRSCADYNNVAYSGAFYVFGKELRNDLIPYIDANFATYADYSEGYDITAARNHRALIGFSMGGMQTVNIGMCECLDLIGSFGALSCAPTTYTSKEINSIITASEYNIDLFYNICGTRDNIAYESHIAATNKICQNSNGKLVSDINYVWQTMPDGHTYDLWYLGAYNFLKHVFR